MGRRIPGLAGRAPATLAIHKGICNLGKPLAILLAVAAAHWVKIVPSERRRTVQVELKMQIYVNGSPAELEDNTPMSLLIAHLGLTGQRIAVEVNAELVPRSRFEAHALREGDRVEIIHAVGGG